MIFKNGEKVRMIGSAGIASIYVASGKADLYKEKKLIYGIYQQAQLLLILQAAL